MSIFRFKVFVITTALVTSANIMPVNAAYTVLPKVGQCFMYTNADVSAPNPPKNPVPCSKLHNAETYIVAKWPVSTPPEKMVYQDAWDIANSLCRAWGNGGRLQDTFFTYWAWYTPSANAWAKGQRWLRCDAMHATNKEEPWDFLSWKGQKFSTSKKA